MTYRQITLEERYHVGVLRQLGLSAAAIARALGGMPLNEVRLRPRANSLRSAATRVRALC
jgi:hypothetical protein